MLATSGRLACPATAGESCLHDKIESTITSSSASLVNRVDGLRKALNLAVQQAVRAALDRKALDLNILDLQEASSFTDYFLICTGTSNRHIQAICDGICEELRKKGLAPAHVEGYAQAEWILLDYLDFVVHVFSQKARGFYDLERLWKSAKKVPVPVDGS